jgi:signal transduction histidine kinase
MWMNIRCFFYKTFPALMAAVFLVSACIVFSLKYAVPSVILPRIYDPEESVNRMFFCLNFYIPFGISALCLYGCLFLSGFFVRAFFLIAGMSSAVIAGYALNALFTVNLCMYSAYVLISAVAFTPPKNYSVTAMVILFFALFLFNPALLGPVVGGIRPSAFSVGEYIVFESWLIILGAVNVSIRFLTDKYINSEATVAHLNAVGTKMLLFNHRLQEYVRNSGEEAVRKDRLRFTSDLHDSSGYVFTNIIAVSDAAVSFSRMNANKIRDTFQLIRNQAQQGLNRTRETLHMIRELEDPVSGSIDTLFEMKKIFQEVTGIHVDIESGNMKHDYGPTVNAVLTRIVQEAFTNSIRHGQASRILIHFWEFPGSLTMTVSDNGIGAQQVVKGIGLAGMEERLTAIGGSLEAYSPEDGGFRLKIIIPLAETLQSAGGSEQQQLKSLENASWEN